MKNTHINITLIMGEEARDLRIPVKITVKQLITELDGIFGRPLDRNKYQLKVVNKGILLAENDVLARYPITNGDCIMIKESM
ncbi:EsaB/YukD family protein [Streptococcus uberis]|nr:EsaB/YukD family protein [Streptococcus uberis]